ncbi:LacI family DNA-binding transcriptional regulator [Roseibium sp.]|uniref:LacI family DNA-binding transcriptional regulator n=1 Tax=Roseibium sp. TaxID=1936156 RepID=UPI0039EEA809
MTHRFPIKEIAVQSGLSTATVDRVLNDRAHVSPQTRLRVADAIAELERQESQLAAKGRRVFIDVVIEAPRRFSREVREAGEAVLADLKPIAVRSRFQTFETMTPETCVALLNRIRKRGSQGVCLKARDTPEIRNAIADLNRKHIPVVTIFTDIPASERIAYAGLDNFNAGRTAAYLMLNLIGSQASTVLTTLSQHAFQGEEDRYRGFRKELSRLRPDIDVLDASGGGGLNLATGREVADRVRHKQEIAGVYSMGGGNVAILNALDAAAVRPSAFIVHDLDEDNLELLKANRLSLVLHHDLKADMLSAYRLILAYHGLGSSPRFPTSDISIITPMNIPAAISGPMKSSRD